MGISTSMTNQDLITTGKRAKDQAEEARKAKASGKQVTDRGTLIVSKSNQNELDGTSFLKIMIAEMKNLDPSASQDNTQYVTQMAQLTTMQQMNDLNKTMSGYSYQGLIGKGVTVDVADLDGKPYTGIVRGISRENNAWKLSMDVSENGKIVNKIFDASTLKSVLGVSDNTNSASMLVNSDFMAAANLASNKDNKVVILATDAKGTQSIVKGTVKSAFLDNGVVKVRVATLDKDLNESTTTTDYPYAYVVKAGNLTKEDMDVKVEDYISKSGSTDTNNATQDPNSPNYDKAAQMNKLNNSKTEVKGSSKYDYSAETVSDQLKKAQDVQNSR